PARVVDLAQAGHAAPHGRVGVCQIRAERALGPAGGSLGVKGLELGEPRAGGQGTLVEGQRAHAHPVELGQRLGRRAAPWLPLKGLLVETYGYVQLVELAGRVRRAQGELRAGRKSTAALAGELQDG